MIIECVSRRAGCKVSDMRNPGQDAKFAVVQARRVSVHLMRDICGAGDSAAGKALEKDHTTARAARLHTLSHVDQSMYNDCYRELTGKEPERSAIDPLHLRLLVCAQFGIDPETIDLVNLPRTTEARCAEAVLVRAGMKARAIESAVFLQRERTSVYWQTKRGLTWLKENREPFSSSTRAVASSLGISISSDLEMVDFAQKGGLRKGKWRRCSGWTDTPSSTPNTAR